jgi:DNA repair protein RadD
MVGRALRPAPGKERALILDHAGNSWAHGLYDFDRSWSLKGDAKRRGGKVPVRRCPKCGALIPSSATTCPECSAVFERQNRTPEEGIGDLEEVSSVALDLRAMPYREVLTWAGGDSERLRLAARARGYKPGWIWHVWRTTPREMGP